jgi:tetratricopeptide (TPR) repeat protein
MRTIYRAALLPLAVTIACARPSAAPVSPAEISELAGRVAREPGNGDLVLRYAAALHSGGRCDSAAAVARRGMVLAPANALGPLVAGQCLERAERFSDAVAVYRAFVARYPGARGVGAVRSREMLASRAAATAVAREALAREAELSQSPADPQTVAVLPLQVTGDSAYQPLSRGLAQMLTSDLALLRRFRMVERLQLGALMDELQLGTGTRVDQATAARVGHLMRAGRMVQGLAAIPSEQQVRIEAAVVTGTGEVTAPASANGRFRDLLTMEKELVVALAARLGYTLSEAERRAVLENGTSNLAAFLAYSRALDAEDRGDYAAAAAHYAEAVRQDPGFQAAREGYQTATSAPAAQTAAAGDLTVLAGEPAPEPDLPALTGTEAGALGSTIGDIASTQAEQSTASTAGDVGSSTSTSTAQPPPPSVVPPVVLSGTIRIVFRLP